METKKGFEKLLQVQKEIGIVKKSKKNPYFKSDYMDINSLLDAVKPVLSKYGVILVQPLSPTGLQTILIDSETGDTLVHSEVSIPQNPDPQKAGSAITYYRRYALQSILAIEAKDDDGNKASGKEVPKNINVKEVNGYLVSTENDGLPFN